MLPQHNRWFNQGAGSEPGRSRFSADTNSDQFSGAPRLQRFVEAHVPLVLGERGGVAALGPADHQGPEQTRSRPGSEPVRADRGSGARRAQEDGPALN